MPGAMGALIDGKHTERYVWEEEWEVEYRTQRAIILCGHPLEIEVCERNVRGVGRLSRGKAHKRWQTQAPKRESVRGRHLFFQSVLSVLV